jgi:hypothetical protein
LSIELTGYCFWLRNQNAKGVAALSTGGIAHAGSLRQTGNSKQMQDTNFRRFA